MSINATLLIQMIAFMLLIWFVNKVLWAPLSKLMEDRQNKIADGLSAAEKGKHELELAEQKAKDVLKDAKTQAQNILGQAEKRGSEIVEDAKVKATEEAYNSVHPCCKYRDEEIVLDHEGDLKKQKKN